MAIQKLHAFEKTAVQCRHAIKRLEMFIEITKDDTEKVIAEDLLKEFKQIRRIIPAHYIDVDLKDKE